MSDSTNTYRVLKIPDTILTAMRRARDQIKTTNVDFLATSVDNYLPGLVAELQRLAAKTEGGQSLDEKLLAAGVIRGDGRAPDELAQQVNSGIGLHRRAFCNILVT